MAKGHPSAEMSSEGTQTSKAASQDTIASPVEALLILAVSIAGGILATSYVARSDGLTQAALTLFFLVVGASAFWTGFQAYQSRQLIQGTPTSKVRSLAIGTAEIQGTAKASGEPFTAPLSHRDACIYHLKIQTETTGKRGKRSKKTALTLQEEAPFFVEDETGKVLVEPSAFLVRPTHAKTITTGLKSLRMLLRFRRCGSPRWNRETSP